MASIINSIKKVADAFGSLKNASSSTTSSKATTGKIVEVQADGKAPKGLSTGDRVLTGGGIYTITGVNADGTYQSKLTDANSTTKNTQLYDGNTTSASNPGSWISNSSKATKTITGSGNTDQYYEKASDNYYENALEGIKKAKQEAQALALKNAYDTNMTAIDRQVAELPEQYAQQRNMASAQSRANARSFAEYLANRGLTNSGASAQGEINRLSTLQTTMGNINANEDKALRDLQNRRLDVTNQYANSLAEVNAGLEADYLQQLYEKNEAERKEREELRKQGNLQYANDYQARINELLAQGYAEDSKEILELRALRGQKIAQQQSVKAQNALTYLQMGYSDQEIAQSLGLSLADVQDIAQYYKTINALQMDNLQASNTNAQLSNQLLQKQIKYYGVTGGGGSKTKDQKSWSYKTHDEIIQNNYVDNTTDNPIMDKVKVNDYINERLEDGTMDNDTANQLRLYYQIPENTSYNLMWNGGTPDMLEKVNTIINERNLTEEQLINVMEAYVYNGYITKQQAMNILASKGIM